MVTKHKAKPRAKKVVVVPARTAATTVGPQRPGAWISVEVYLPLYDRPVLVTDGVELAHCTRERSDRRGEHYCLVDEGSEFSDVTHWMEEPLLPNGKPPKRGGR